MTSFSPRIAAPCSAVKSASFTALMSAPASSSTLTASSALIERRPRCMRGVNVDRPRPAATINGVVPSSRRQVDLRAGGEQRLDDVGAGLGRASPRCRRSPLPPNRCAAVGGVGRHPQRRRAAQIAGAARERLERALLRVADVAHDHRRRGDARVRRRRRARAAPSPGAAAAGVDARGRRAAGVTERSPLRRAARVPVVRARRRRRRPRRAARVTPSIAPLGSAPWSSRNIANSSAGR